MIVVGAVSGALREMFVRNSSRTRCASRNSAMSAAFSAVAAICAATIRSNSARRSTLGLPASAK